MAKKRPRLASKQPRAAAASPSRTAVALPGSATAELTFEGKFAWWVILALAFLVPMTVGTLRFLGIDTLFVHDIYDTSKVALLRVGSVLALLAWVADIVRNGGKLRYSPVLWVFGAFLVWAGISTVLSVEPSTSFFGKYRRYDGMWSYLMYAALLFVTMQYANRPGRIKQLAQAVAFASVPIAIYGLLQTLGIEPLRLANPSFEANRSFSTYGNPDLLAGFLAFGIFTSIGLALSEQDTRWRAFYWLATLLNLAVSITAFSRSIWVGSVVGFIALAVVVYRHRPRWTGLDWGLSGAAVAATASFIIGSLSSENAVMNFGKRVVSIFEFSSGSASTRFMIWDSAWQATQERPLFGFGPDTFRLIYRRFQSPDYAALAGHNSVADNVHNYPLQLAAGVGILGMLLFYAAFIWAAIVSAKTLWEPVDPAVHDRSRDAARSTKILMGSMWAACIAFMVHLMFGLALPASFFLMALFTAALLVPSSRSLEVRPLGNSQAWAAILATAALTVALISLAFTQVYADNRFVNAENSNRLAQQQIGAGALAEGTVAIRTSVEYYAAAVRLSPHNDHFRYTLFANQAWLSLISLNAGDQSAEAMVSEAVAFGRDMLKRNPWEYDNVTFVINYYNQLADAGVPDYLEEARQIGEENISLTPNGMTLRHAYASTLLRLGEYDLAEEQLRFAIDQAPRYEEPQQLLNELIAKREAGELQ